MTTESAIKATEVLIGWAVALQTLELLKIRHVFADGSIWDWSTLKPDFPKLALLLKPEPFKIILALRLLAAIALPLVPGQNPLLPVFLVLSSALVCLRWRGTYNGGSDYMTLLILLSLSVARMGIHHPLTVSFSLGYIAIQSTLSYFISGILKIRNPEWRSGEALAQFLNSPHYELPKKLRQISANAPLCFLGSWAVLIFECAFPLAFFKQELGLLFIGCAILFHLANTYALGLNRFFWAWIASYPSLLFFSGHLTFTH